MTHPRPFLITGDTIVSETARLALDVHRHRKPEEEAAGYSSPQQHQRVGAFAQLMRLGSGEIGARPFLLAVIQHSGIQLSRSGSRHYQTMRRNAHEVFTPLMAATFVSARDLEDIISEAFPVTDPGSLN